MENLDKFTQPDIIDDHTDTFHADDQPCCSYSVLTRSMFTPIDWTARITCNEIHRDNSTLFVKKGDTAILNCTCLRSNESTWLGPDGQNKKSDETVLIAYADGLHKSPFLNTTNIDIYGSYNDEMCYLRIKNYSKANDGVYECSYFLSGDIYIRRYNLFSKRPPTNLKVIDTTEKNIKYGTEGVQIDLTCTVQNGIPASTLIWTKKNLIVANGSSDTLLYQFTPTRFDHLESITCFALSDLLTSPMFKTIYLDIQYIPYLTIVQQTDGSIEEGESVELCCHSNSNPHVHYLAWVNNNHEEYSWRRNPTTKLNGTNIDFCLPTPISFRNQSGNYTCFGENEIVKSNTSVVIKVLYPPDVKVAHKISKQNTMIVCIPDGYPDNYTFYDWVHKSEFNEHIRSFPRTPDGQLIINKSQDRKENENDGIYVCTVSNGIPNSEGKLIQTGQTYIVSSGPPVFVSENKPVQIGEYGKTLELTICIYDKLQNSKVLLKQIDIPVKVKTILKRITTYDTFHGVLITVPGIQYTFYLLMTSADDFLKYTVEACNDVGCNYFDVKVKPANFSDTPRQLYSYGWQITGILLGGSLIFSICLHIFCLLKRKANLVLVSEIPLEVHYSEVGTLNYNSASIQTLTNNAQETVTVTSFDGPAVERTNSHVSALKLGSSSSDSVQSLSISLLNDDGYENPYQMIDPDDIEIYPYSIVWSNLYQNTTIFPKEIKSNAKALTPSDKERVPWLIIYKKG
ncbi:unnamed protein product [Mytilus coruscus]|uniref:Ig-like domain-containing protein n=1 Tax=Mytilus coruscus TaxID=42192 RepID=A0A6J8B8J2_MYTCO|nr:unnamed protein product [Mytilus coruscus]